MFYVQSSIELLYAINHFSFIFMLFAHISHFAKDCHVAAWFVCDSWPTCFWFWHHIQNCRLTYLLK